MACLLLCMAGVRGGALAMRIFSGFGLHGTRKSVPNSPAWRLRLRKMRQLKSAAPTAHAPTRELSEWDTCGSADRTSSREGRSWRRRLFQKRRERSVRAVMVPKTPGEKPPGPTLSQAQAGAGSGRSPGVREIFGFCASSSWKKRSAKRSVEGEEAGSDQGYDLLQARPDCVGQ